MIADSSPSGSVELPIRLIARTTFGSVAVTPETSVVLRTLLVLGAGVGADGASLTGVIVTLRVTGVLVAGPSSATTWTVRSATDGFGVPSLRSSGSSSVLRNWIARSAVVNCAGVPPARVSVIAPALGVTVKPTTAGSSRSSSNVASKPAVIVTANESSVALSTSVTVAAGAEQVHEAALLARSSARPGRRG